MQYSVFYDYVHFISVTCAVQSKYASGLYRPLMIGLPLQLLEGWKCTTSLGHGERSMHKGGGAGDSPRGRLR